MTVNGENRENSLSSTQPEATGFDEIELQHFNSLEDEIVFWKTLYVFIDQYYFLIEQIKNLKIIFFKEHSITRKSMRSFCARLQKIRSDEMLDAYNRSACMILMSLLLFSERSQRRD